MTATGEAASVAQEDWFQDKRLHHVLDLLNRDGGEARIVGGAVRNALLGMKVGDIDIATTLHPQDVVERAGEADIKCVPTGIDHGTVTLIAGGTPFEVTTLRADVASDGRRATVAYGADWSVDAHRRDLTINGLYADADGKVIDLVDGLADIESRTVRFIGDPQTRIKEDYLRILRFFRFFAWYGGGRPDADGLRACARLKSGLSGLSAERVWSELKRLFAAPDPSRAMLWMRQSGVLSAILPESEKWGIDAIFGMIETGAALDWTPDPLLRLMAVVPDDPDRVDAMARRLRMSNNERGRLVAWAKQPQIVEGIADAVLRRQLYRGNSRAVEDRLRIRLAALRKAAQGDDAALIGAGACSRLLQIAQEWTRPEFPISGKDLLKLGVEPGPGVGGVLTTLEDAWIDSGFILTRDELLKRAGDLSGDLL
ncbi:CCA tRNA nucleotidyltransferase [Hoeflea prorocentri]|uniref:CCA tRNA nucleotidyltransferase n=1 Tax=Hoeflea prorocentri TaxID=1922333 RepID=A0A9X3ZGA1_9HYPH|nr:CCA tRNA nucleotidyltransferase [Hoeflea prorocentri]MCY6379530.1 CCA tRNA nucleotidyltransferase [Hoeflea prorocentri]MDA5397330.1 CCA tRNA nucleotidyltransferase [Hoeflea prorocentri]